MISRIFMCSLLLPLLMLSAFAADSNFTTYSVGKFKFIALNDRVSQVDESLFRYSDTEKLKTYLSEPGARDGALNYYLLDTGKEKILFDTGLNESAGGNVTVRLAEAGYKPEDITIINLTHMHGDHIGGMIDKDKRVVFPSATVYVAKEEADYWKGKSELVDNVMSAYKGKIKTFSQNTEIVQGVKSVPAFGHTPGHTIFRVYDSGKTVVVLGDLLHARVQFANPSIYLTYDVDPVMAVDVRKKFLLLVAAEKLPIAGMHVYGGGVGRVTAIEEGYKFSPGM